MVTIKSESGVDIVISDPELIEIIEEFDDPELTIEELNELLETMKIGNQAHLMNL